MAIAIIVILCVSYMIYKRYIARYFMEPVARTNANDQVTQELNSVTVNNQSPNNPNTIPANTSIPIYTDACQIPHAPPTYEEAMKYNT